MRRLLSCFSSILAGLLLALAALPAGAALLPSDKAVLEDLYNSTNGAGWTLNDNWMTGDPCANKWRGITCDATGTRVFMLSLSSNNLTGTLPGRLGWLTAARRIDVSSNRLTGPLPGLAALVALESFNAEGNQLSGPLPSLAGLSALSVFHVYGNQLTGSIPSLSGLTALFSFLVHDNQLTGSIPSLSGLPTLRYFHVHNNQLTGTPPAAPPSLWENGSLLCPNFLHAPSPTDAAWDKATAFSTPWSQSCTPGWQVTVFVGANGRTDKGTHAVVDGARAKIAVMPDPGYEARVGSNCGGALSGGVFTSDPVTATCIVTVNFEIKEAFRQVTVTIGANGSADKGTHAVADGARAQITVTPDAGYVADVAGTCGGLLSDDGVYTTEPVTQDCTVIATFREKADQAWQVTVTAGPNGSADTGAHAVADGATLPVTVTPDAGYVPVVSGTCGGLLSDGGVYTTAPVTQDCTVEVRFQKQGTQHPVDRVTPVPTLGEWALLLLALVLGGFGWRQARLRGH